MKKTVLYFLLISSFAFAQNGKVPVKNADGKNCFEYTIKAGDNWYSIARQYKISVAELRLANKKDNGQLTIGKIIFIPADRLKVNDPHFDKNHLDKAATKNSSSVKHQVASTETLFSIAKKYKVSVDEIRKENNLTSNNIRKGQILIIHPGSDPTNSENLPASKIKSVTSKEAVEKSTPLHPSPPESNIVKANSDAHSSDTNAKPSVQEKILSEKNQKDAAVVFAKGRQQMNETGVAAWIDDEEINPGKYYALHRTAPVGTIVKITNRMNSRSIFVKVVGKLPDTGDNDGLIIKISKASAEKLGVIDPRFQADLVYGISGEKQ